MTTQEIRFPCPQVLSSCLGFASATSLDLHCKVSFLVVCGHCSFCLEPELIQVSDRGFPKRLNQGVPALCQGHCVCRVDPPGMQFCSCFLLARSLRSGGGKRLGLSQVVPGYSCSRAHDHDLLESGIRCSLSKPPVDISFPTFSFCVFWPACCPAKFVLPSEAAVRFVTGH